MNQTTPKSVMQQALGDDWDRLDESVKRHYAMVPGREERMTLQGRLEVFHSRIAELFLLPGRLFGALIPYQGKEVPTEVKNWTQTNNQQAMFWHRQLQFPGKPLAVFKSRMEYLQDDEIIEYVRFNLGIRMRLSVEDGALVFTSTRYLWQLGFLRLSLPTWLILGHARILERGLSENRIAMEFEMVHPWFGKTFGYAGDFVIKED